MRSLFLLTILVAITSFHTRQKSGIRLPKEFQKIPAGILVLKTDSMVNTTIEEFYMSAYEVSNLQYREFLKDESANPVKNEMRQLVPDSTGWALVKENAESLKNYFQNPAFNKFPVVNISHYAAERYCKWLEEKIKNMNPGYQVTVRLPTKAEWIWAAQGGRSQAMYPWTNYHLYNKKGEALCNFRKLHDREIYRNRQTGKPEVAEAGSSSIKFTARVNSYSKNDFGLYNTCGNVAEMTFENGISMGGSWNDFGGDVHIRAESKFDRPSPMVGFRPAIVIREKINRDEGQEKN